MHTINKYTDENIDNFGIIYIYINNVYIIIN